MAGPEILNVAVPPELADALQASVARGEYASTGEIVCEALRLWAEAHSPETVTGDDLNKAVEAGLASGAGIPSEVVFSELKARFPAAS